VGRRQPDGHTRGVNRKQVTDLASRTTLRHRKVASFLVKAMCDNQTGARRISSSAGWPDFPLATFDYT